MTETRKIPQQITDFINRYFELHVLDQKIVCPYYINKGGFLKKPVFSGKGSPDDIEEAANQLLKNHDFLRDKPEMIRKEMEVNGLGIDCSGLVYQVYNKWLD